jgi:hypothetical protein
LERDFESIFRAGMLKILLQQYRSRVDGALARAFLTLLQHWSGAVTCPAC